ncbi:hypothetical protein DNTS_021525 [Danionella cerebrum]|uniref:Uncharacterized protein n=1 Tax=Danionella cerebrum TaxID=2873325 RepID=A0A553QI82_9TELE|nr:hypothetical protein DNTS_021525 [Danionella translucida]
MMPEPLKTALCPVPLEDTSLALPSDRELRSAEQRVLEQVHTIKRSKSKKFSSRSVSGLSSPTSPESDAVFYDFKLSPVVSLSGPLFSRGGTMTNGDLMGNRVSESRERSQCSRSSGSPVTHLVLFYYLTWFLGTLPDPLYIWADPLES